MLNSYIDPTDDVVIDDKGITYVGYPLVNPLKSFAGELRKHASDLNVNIKDPIKQKILKDYKAKLFEAANLITDATKLVSPKDVVIPHTYWKSVAFIELLLLIAITLFLIWS